MTRWEGDDIHIEVPRVTEAHVRMTAGELAVTAANGPARLHVEVGAGDPAVVTLDHGVLTVAQEPDQRWLPGLGVARAQAVITLTVPPDTPVVLSSVSADVVAAGLQAGASVTTVSGALTVTDLGGAVNIRTVSGDIEAETIGTELTVNTVSGNATVTGRTDRLTARSVSGDLTFDLDGAPAASLSTVSGEVLLRIPADASAHVDMSTMSGKLDSAFPIAGSTGRRRLSGLVGGSDGPRIEIRTMSGDVALLRKELAPASALDGHEVTGPLDDR